MGGLVYKIIETALSPKSSLPLGVDLGLGLGLVNCQTTIFWACPCRPSVWFHHTFIGLLGQMKVANNTPHLAHLETKFTWVENGGKASPKDCVPKTNVAIVVPYRLE